MRPPRAIFVAATAQHVGKSTTSLGIFSGISKRVDRVAYMKPVGQKYVEVDDGFGNISRVDKDVPLFKEYFGLDSCEYRDMSPVVLPPGYTKDFLDGRISEEDQVSAVKTAFERISLSHDFTVVEGTGHAAVGSIVNLDNARVASLLGVDMVFVANGGLGSCFDQLSLNMLKCKEHGVRVKAVVINKVIPDKVEMVREYMGKALAKYDIPLAGNPAGGK